MSYPVGPVSNGAKNTENTYGTQTYTHNKIALKDLNLLPLKYKERQQYVELFDLLTISTYTDDVYTSIPGIYE